MHTFARRSRIAEQLLAVLLGRPAGPREVKQKIMRTRVTRGQVVGTLNMRAILAAVVMFSSAGVPAAWADRLIDIHRSTITVHVFKSGLFRAFADNHTIQAPLAEGSLDDTEDLHVQIVIDVQRMRVVDPGLSTNDRQVVQARMLGEEVLDANKFRRITFHSVAIKLVDSTTWLVRGELELHGHIRPIAMKVVRDAGHYRGTTTLKQTQFGMTPVSIAAGTVKVKDEIQIDFDIATTVAS